MSLIICYPDLVNIFRAAEHKPTAFERLRPTTVLCQPAAKVNARYGRAIELWRKITLNIGEQSLVTGLCSSLAARWRTPE